MIKEILGAALVKAVYCPPSLYDICKKGYPVFDGIWEPVPIVFSREATAWANQADLGAKINL
jgi:hypothetical protein